MKTKKFERGLASIVFEQTGKNSFLVAWELGGYTIRGAHYCERAVALKVYEFMVAAFELGAEMGPKLESYDLGIPYRDFVFAAFELGAEMGPKLESYDLGKPYRLSRFAFRGGTESSIPKEASG